MKLSTSKTAKVNAAAFVLLLATIGYTQATAGVVSAASGFTVTRSDDRNATCIPGDCSLREAVNAANASQADDTIAFADGLTLITLINEIVINAAGTLVIGGPGAGVLTIDGPGTSFIFLINSATLTISGLTLTGCQGSGAIYAESGSLTLDGVYVTGNSAAWGGGVSFNGGAHRIINSTFSANNGFFEGGAIHSSSSSLLIVNSTISGNTSYNGGGIFSEDSGLTLRNVTITNNSNSGITASYATVHFGNSIIAGNTNTISPGYGNEINCYCYLTSNGGNLVGDSPGDSSPGIVYQPTDIRDTDPLLGPLQNNGGTTPTHALLAGSPVIDKGLNALVSPLASVFDQRGPGFPRIRDGNGDHTLTVDIGAFELQLGSIGPTPFDFDGDGRADISVFRPSDGNWYLDRSQAGFYAAQFGLSSDKIVPADYDGDGRTDIAVFRPSLGTWYISNSSDGTFRSNTFGLANDIPTAADYDGDGHADLSVFQPSDGTWYRTNSSDGQFRAIQFGQNGDIPMTGDRDADGKTDLTVFRPSNGYWYIHRSSDNGVLFDNFGLNGDIPLNGDFDGDGSADLAVFRPSNGTWYIARSGGVPSQNFDAIPFGLPSDIPVPADYDGDGRTDLAVYRDGVWYLRQSTGGPTAVQFGLGNDKPIPSAYVP